MSKKKIIIPIREGKPTSCIVCGSELHRKSEHFCSENCANVYQPPSGFDKQLFLSKWKIRKRKELRDPLIQIRKKTRRKTNELLKQGKLNRKPCLICGNKNVHPHHEDYSNPFKVIWLCEQHHKAYHEGKITLFKNKLEWDPNRLIPKKQKGNIPKKYQQLKNSYDKQKEKI